MNKKKFDNEMKRLKNGQEQIAVLEAELKSITKKFKKFVQDCQRSVILGEVIEEGLLSDRSLTEAERIDDLFLLIERYLEQAEDEMKHNEALLEEIQELEIFEKQG